LEEEGRVKLVSIKIFANMACQGFMQLTIAESSKEKTDTSGNEWSSVEERGKEHHNGEAR
jgi:hypothetical protein